MSRRDTRIVYGVGCTWWDDIYKIGKTPGPISLPCCPHCRGLLLEMPTIDDWYKGIPKFEAAGHPGYGKMMDWARGKCFPNMDVLKKAYTAQTGIAVAW